MSAALDSLDGLSKMLTRAKAWLENGLELNLFPDNFPDYWVGSWMDNKGDTMSKEWMDGLVGVWTFEGRSVPDNAAHRQTGVEHVTRRGAWLVIEGEDYRFQLAMAPETSRVTGDFIHWKHPHLWTYDGVIESDGRLHLRSRGPDMEGKGGEADYDDVFEIVSQDERRSIGRIRDPDGNWRDFSQSTYRRKGC